MIVDIIPTKKLPRQLSVLSYLVPVKLEKKIKIGQIVDIPLRNSLTTGVVAGIKTRSNIPGILKYIIDIKHENPLFARMQLELFEKLAKYYYVSASLFVHQVMPKLLKNEWGKIKKTKKPDKQFLILVPRINMIEKMIESLEFKKQEVSIIHGQLTRKEKINMWHKAMTSPGVFIGTRAAVFYPYANLDNIIIDEEESVDYKNYDMNPRYDARIVAEMICDRTILISGSPSVEAYYKYKPKLKTNKKNTKIINLNNEIRRENYSFIGEELEESIKEVIKNKKQVFLFINKKGESSNTNCKDCNYVFSCPECGLPLIKDRNNIFNCYYCEYSEELPPFCPKCTGPNFKSSGLGVQKIENNLKKIFLNNKIIIISKNNEPNESKADIIIGTEFAIDKINWNKIGLVGIINADQLWQHAEFGTGERAYCLISKLLTSALKNAKFVIQTFSPDHYIIESIQRNKPGIFYNKELEFRKSFDYPPFYKLIKLSVLDKSETSAKKEADKIYNKIKLKINKNINISEPILIMRKKIRGKYKFNIILKLKKLSDFDNLIKIIPNNWLIDVEPKTLLD